MRAFECCKGIKSPLNDLTHTLLTGPLRRWLSCRSSSLHCDSRAWLDWHSCSIVCSSACSSSHCTHTIKSVNMQKCSKCTLNAGDPQTGTFQNVLACVLALWLECKHTAHDYLVYKTKTNNRGNIFLRAPVSDFVKHLAGTFLVWQAWIKESDLWMSYSLL